MSRAAATHRTNGWASRPLLLKAVTLRRAATTRLLAALAKPINRSMSLRISAPAIIFCVSRQSAIDWRSTGLRIFSELHCRHRAHDGGNSPLFTPLSIVVSTTVNARTASLKRSNVGKAFVSKIHSRAARSGSGSGGARVSFCCFPRVPCMGSFSRCDGAGTAAASSLAFRSASAPPHTRTSRPCRVRHPGPSSPNSAKAAATSGSIVCRCRISAIGRSWPVVRNFATLLASRRRRSATWPTRKRPRCDADSSWSLSARSHTQRLRAASTAGIGGAPRLVRACKTLVQSPSSK
mmetsp:Transcript_22991/g.71332  ORF Transcript_22991/g.71332 Transcript_22991/m.71332 type:complete len:293 (-) Transcript_22991:267-1145(-)